MKLEAAGRPTVVIATDRFASLALRAAGGYGLDAARIAVVPHPIGGATDDELRRVAVRAVGEVMGLLTGARAQGG